MVQDSNVRSVLIIDVLNVLKESQLKCVIMDIKLSGMGIKWDVWSAVIILLDGNALNVFTVFVMSARKRKYRKIIVQTVIISYGTLVFLANKIVCNVEI